MTTRIEVVRSLVEQEGGSGGFSTWMDIHIEAQKDHKSISSYLVSKKTGSAGDRDQVDLAIAEDIRRDMAGKVSKTKELARYEVGAIAEAEIGCAGLTKRQAEIVGLRQSLSCKEIGELLGVSPKTVFETYSKAVRKIKGYKLRQDSGIPGGLSDQQAEIYRLSREGYKPKEIAGRLGISPETVYKQLGRIKQKTMTKA